MGVAYSDRIRKRVVLLEKTKLMIEEIKLQIKFLNLPVYDILKNLSEKDHLKTLKFVEESCKLIDKSVDFHIAWQETLKRTSLPYKREEMDKLLHIGLNLGTSDSENQLSMLSLNSEYFDEYIRKAKLEEKKYGKLSTTLGILSGCSVFILLI